MRAKAFAKFDINKAESAIKALKQQFATDDVVNVGIPGSEQEPTGESTAKIAAVHEFGYAPKNIPERSFLRGGIKANREMLRERAAADLAQVGLGKMSMYTALNRLGVAATGAVKKYIRQGDFAPLHPRTIEAKGSSRPLIDTGNMMQSVTHVVGKKDK